jgi:predicted O-methyltransferase YrrM
LIPQRGHTTARGQYSVLSGILIIRRWYTVSIGGTPAYGGLEGLPPLVARAVAAAAEAGFEYSCRPEHGRLLAALAAGAELVGETGTGFGVGLAWLVSGARPGTHFVSVERDGSRAAAAATLFADEPGVSVLAGDWSGIGRDGPYDLLVLDGGGGKADGDRADPLALLRPGGTLVLDDLTPATHWPPLFQGVPDTGRTQWYDHPELDAAELRLAPDLTALVATRRFPTG